MSMYEDFVTDEGMEIDGVWMDRANYRIKIAHSGGANKAFSAAFDKAIAPHRKAMAAGRMIEQVAEKILVECYAKHVIKDWNVLLIERDDDGAPILDERHRPTPIMDDNSQLQWQRGIHDKEGKVIAFNAENVAMTLRALPRLFAEIRSISEDFNNFLETRREEEAKNS